MKYRFSIIALLFCVCLSVYGQTVITGVVTDSEDKQPMTGVVITLIDTDEEVVTYSITNKEGAFNLKTDSELTSFKLQARLLGYENHVRTVENKSQNLYIEMSFGEIVLREVEVKSQAMWSREDTLVYSVDAFKSAGDKNIGDLLKKLPGVEVSESGGIKYQGESINKFYIEGLDLLERRYGIATNNVPVDAVQNVEIIENHQPVRAIKDDVFSDRAAVNLKLKKDKLSRPVGTVSIGAGYAEEPVWLAEAFAMSAGAKQQFIAMYKTNNSAKDIASELNAQTLSSGSLEDVSGFSQRTLLNSHSFRSPPLEKKRHLFNNSHIGSVNSLWKTGEHSQFRLNLQYLHDVSEENSTRNSEYFLPEGTLRISEVSMLSRRTNTVDATATFTNNSPGYYLNNSLNWNGSQNSASSMVEMNMIGVNQHFDTPYQQIKNDFNFVKKWGKQIWDITSFAVYSSQPQMLSVSIDTISNDQHQQVELSGFYTRNSTYYSTGFRNSNFILKGAFVASIDRYNSELTHPVFVDSTSSDIASNHFILELIPTYVYRKNRLTINADLTLRRHIMKIDNKLNNGVGYDDYSNFFADPSVRVNYRFGPMLTGRLTYRYSNSIGDFMDLTNVFFMSGYRSFSKRSGVLPLNMRQSFGGNIQYRNPLTTFFFNTGLTYSPSRRNLVSSQRFVGTESVSGSRELKTNSNMLIWSAYAGKYFPDIRTNASLGVNYNNIIGERQQQGVLYPLRSTVWAFMPKVNVKLSDASSVNYQTVASSRTTEITNTASSLKSTLWQVTQQLTAYYIIADKWQLNGRLEHSYNEITSDKSVDMLFADIGVSYKINQFEFDLSWNNLFNQKSYTYSIYNELDKFDYTYNLRPSMLMLTVSLRY